jgi:hypothetical protein
MLLLALGRLGSPSPISITAHQTTECQYLALISIKGAGEGRFPSGKSVLVQNNNTNRKETKMKQGVCAGIDLHSNNVMIGIVDERGRRLKHQ